MATRTATRPGLTGAVIPFGAVAAFDTFLNNGRMMLRVNNAGVAATLVTIKDVGSTSPDRASAFDADVEVTVNPGQEKTIGPFPPYRFNDPTGACRVEYSVTTSVTSALEDAS